MSDEKAPKARRLPRIPLRIKAALVALFHIAGIVAALHAVMDQRTSSGAVAWGVSLVTFPYVAVPAYLVFGRSKFNGYVAVRAAEDMELNSDITALRAAAAPFVQGAVPDLPELRALSRMVDIPFTSGNQVDLLIDGEETFESILTGIASAEDFVLVQFYIVRSDSLGTALKDAMVERAQAGVPVYFLYDEVGSSGLGRRYVEDLQLAGVRASAFNTTRGSGNRFQLNFRNHRKIVVVDGEVAWVGGHNVGDEYLGRDPKFGRWRDTHVRVEGPAVLGAQASFLEDWNWAQEEILELQWPLHDEPRGSSSVLMVPSGPADRFDTAELMFLQAIVGAKERIWIASPYFVPDRGIISALELASMRGVDVRLLIPDNPDHMSVYLAGWSFMDDLPSFGVEVWRFQDGFLHQKAFLVDDAVAAVGTANLDNRSFRLNFEVTALVVDPEFNRQVSEMFDEDFRNSRLMGASEFGEKPFWFRAAARSARLFAPVL